MTYVWQILLVLIPLGTIAGSGYFALCQVRGHKTKEAYYLFGFCLLLFTVTYSVLILKIKIGGTVNIETAAKEVNDARNQVLATKKEVNEIGQILLETSYLILDGEGRYGGMPKGHKDAVLKQSAKLEELLQPSFPSARDKAKAMVRELNKKGNGS